MEIFEDDDLTKEDGSFLCNGEFEFGLNCGVASDKGICIPWVCVGIDSRYAVGDATGGECVESDDMESVWKAMKTSLALKNSWLGPWIG